ncbi:MAG: hypothetical protein AVDCRST_MAG03-22 [uncultured Rubrobacteraceae bacterium]|uniref:Uncharacterized protein n=1 Tax=uncultured Rubrobacteraceae bacterium TaxID=349277 RepID=A0A6J4NDE8_9ACTN|nr:MAG: hypothetical protein AVDCRST_MAG03-22 [uncultured Rubrobacteraceae bacterium]
MHLRRGGEGRESEEQERTEEGGVKVPNLEEFDRKEASAQPRLIVSIQKSGNFGLSEAAY